MASPWYLVHLGGASFASHSPCVYKAWVSKMCLLLDTPCGRRSVGALSLLPLGSLLGSTKKLPVKFVRESGNFHGFKLKMLHGYDACVVYWAKGASRRIWRQKQGETSFSPIVVFLFSRNSRVRFWGLIL